MFRFCSAVVLLFTFWHCTSAMKCVFSNGNEVYSQIGLTSAVECPRLFDDPNDVFCCVNDNGRYYCCDADEFEKNLGAGIVIAIAVGAIVVVCVILCICCCCCPCCCLYKRRHRGTVYGNMPQPGVHTTVVVPQPVAMPTHTPMYPPSAQQPGIVLQAQPPQPGFYPPTYDEAMVKQAPYNPNY